MSSEFQSSSSGKQSEQPILEALTCDICPHLCKIKPGESGFCQVIENTGSSVKNVYEGHCSNIALEPIEKRPFFHFEPGSSFLSVGFRGCSLSCDYCQNFRVSQSVEAKSKYYSPPDLIDLALDRNAHGIAFTYNEPTIYHNYIEEVGHEIGRRNSPLKLVIKTSGFASPYVIRNLCLYANAVNVDLKGDDAEYHDVCKGSLGPVLKSIEMIWNMNVHLEISYMVLPSKIDDSKFNSYFRDWLSEISPEIPLHLLYFYPFHRMKEPSYKPSQLIELLEMFREKLSYVYVSNHFALGLAPLRNTMCSTCGALMVDRQKKASVLLRSCCNKSPLGIS